MNCILIRASWKYTWMPSAWISSGSLSSKSGAALDRAESPPASDFYDRRKSLHRSSYEGAGGELLGAGIGLLAPAILILMIQLQRLDWDRNRPGCRPGPGSPSAAAPHLRPHRTVLRTSGLNRRASGAHR